MGLYLYYDVKGIQSFIFKIPKLKFIIGGSALIDRFDKETVKNLNIAETTHIFSGGGRGAFFCETEDSVDALKLKIIEKAQTIGLDIRFGQNDDFSQAVQHANEFYAFVPEMHDGPPCPESGLYPVKAGEKCHSVIEERLYKSGKKVFRRFEEALLKDVLIPGKSKDELVFFHNVNDEDPDGKAGAFALGNRNRWAVICMDGNDMGKQFRTQLDKKLPSNEMKTWIQTMSNTLAQITAEAAFLGVQRVVSEWAADEGKKAVVAEGPVTLPIRPLLIGGDDIIVLCHCSYAVTFVKEVMRIFEERSRKCQDLWPATEEGLSISAGILYTSVSLPLHTAIPYAEALLENAKTYGRKKTEEGKAPPACIDWEQITDTVIDTPKAKRKREFVFFDGSSARYIKLTQRPYTLEDFTKVETLAHYCGYNRKMALPRTLRHKILPALQKGYAERLAFAAQVKKNYPALFTMLNEFDMANSKWQLNETKAEQSTQLIDALMLLEEDERMQGNQMERRS